MLEFLKRIFTQENITFVLATIGSIGTIISGINIFMSSRRKPLLQISGHKITDGKSLLIYAGITNRSNQTITISNIGMKLGDLIYPCHQYPLMVLEESSHCGKELLYHHEFYSLPFPVTIPAHGGTSGYIYFEFPEVSLEIDATQATFVIDSNRKKATEMTLSLGPQLH